ncbi:MAG: Ldh family oxidoreductase [Verrucomicrobiales bacterium]|nr:Ldh family oxidoreductase [Verrucomicrobiales bacterium]
MHIEVGVLADLGHAALCRAGMKDTDARLSAEVLVLADSWGIFTHGIKNLPGYLRRIDAGGIRRDGQPRVIAEGPAWAIVDGAQSLGMVGSVFAMDLALAKARSAGFGYVGLGNSCHFGAAGCYAVRAAHDGMLGWAMANDTPTVTAPGARGAVLGSNPFAFAAPVEGEDPLLLDFATSTVAGGKLFAAAAEGRKVPEGWVVDDAGRPTTDPSVWPKAGALTPMAGHKGYGIALMIEVLSAVVTQGPAMAEVLSWSFADPSLPTGHSAAFLAMNVRAMPGGEALGRRLAEMARRIRALPKAPEGGRILLPGEREWAFRKRALREGLELPGDVAHAVDRLRERCGIQP